MGLDGLPRDDQDPWEEAGTEADCDQGKPIYLAWYWLYPQDEEWFFSSDRVAPGDRISASVTTDGNGRFTLILADRSAGWKQRTPTTLEKARLLSAEVVAEGLGQLSNFGTVSFTGATANGKSLGDLAGLKEIDMIDPNGTLRAATGSLSNGAFTVTWKHS